MKRSTHLFLILLLCGTCIHGLQAQTVPVGSPALEGYYRRLQLQGQLDSSISFSLRPLQNQALKEVDVFYPSSPDSLGGKKKLRFKLLPLSWQQQFNSHHPYGSNDGTMIPAKGYQTTVSAGFYAQFGPLSIQLRPEFVYAANPSFQSFGEERSDGELKSYYGNYNRIDAPERFGEGAYDQFSWGQSSIRITVGPASVALSNENLWWGPGIRNSILMSNNADGFKHLTFNTVRPVKTPIGSFEGQVFSGKLEDSYHAPLPVQETSAGQDLWRVPRRDWRYLTGVNINYQPRWLPGLFLGFTRVFTAYHSDLNTLADYLPFFTPFQKNKRLGTGLVEETYDRDQRTSLYARWLFTKAHAEVYFEYALNDNSVNLRDFIGAPDHSRAYLFGISKLVPLRAKKDEFIQVSAEVIQLSQTMDGLLLRGAGGFYYHGGIDQGYTNKGQVLGAGTGSGGNMQSLDLNWVKGVKTLGLSIERYEHNRDFFDSADFGDAQGGSRSWVDFAIAAQGTWDHKNLLFNAKLRGVKSLNYQWRQKDLIPESYYIPNNDVYNFHAELGITFRF